MVSAASLVAGALLALLRRWRPGSVGAVLAFGAGGSGVGGGHAGRRHVQGGRDRAVDGVAAVCALATVGGYRLAAVATGDVHAMIDGFAAGPLLVMLVDSMIPEAKAKTGSRAGLATVLGFAVAAALFNLT